MSLKSGLKALLDSATITAVPVRIGRKPKGSAVEENTIILRVVASNHINTMQGTNALQSRLVQLDCWADNPKNLEGMVKAVHQVLNGYVGSLNDGTYVQGCFPTSDIDLDDETLKQVGASIDFNVWFLPGEFLSPPA